MLRRIGNRSVVEEDLRACVGAGTGRLFFVPVGYRRRDQFIATEGFTIEKYSRSQAERGILLAIYKTGKGSNIDSEFFDKTSSHRAVWSRAFNGKSSAKPDQHIAGLMKFVALGVSAEVVVIIQDQNAGVCLALLAIKVGSGESADSASHNHQVVFFACVRWGSGMLPEVAIANGVRCFVYLVMVAAHTVQSRRVIARSFLRIRGVRGCGPNGSSREQWAGRHGDAVQKIAARDAAVHSKIAIVRIHWQIMDV